MKTRFLPALLAFCAAGTVLAADPAAPKAIVNFDNWQKYTDIKDQYIPTDQGEQSILDELKQAIIQDANQLVHDGVTLTITFQDIDLAGDIEPGRSAQWDQVRIVKDIYPPRFKFTWSLADAAGKVLKQGKEDMTDTSFQMRATIDPSDRLHYEKDILKDWMQGAVHGVVGS